ncbi:MAG: hypothetical protein P8O77_00065 [Emcibacteraceae bacterium]|jgi:hypothetical protein|uniref:hypothetical protein n=1 Tax=Pseudemcibacter sp. TaxID=2943293 RepID=UPI002311BDB9|nr:hypothetical protein [Kordiimonadaceae bacterium]MDA7568548.1 hypothetical protein [Emcibacteraceae bacterium]MDA9553817.1 hypothetical protein [Emcibacteraceae bacterium]MDG1019862.1 hypothetical protein [Emcibacteraceae bacterium]
MKNICTYIICLVISLPFQNAVYAQNGDNIVVPCAVPFYRELDFIVGDWQVFHNSNGKLAGYDRIGRTLRGCAIQQSWISLDDHFSSEYVPFRMYGKSLTAFNGSEWVHMWVDNNAGVQILKGGPEKDRFVLRSEKPVGGYEYKLTWQKGQKGRLLNLHERRKVSSNSEDTWETLYEWVYIKNLNQNILPEDEEVE